MVPGETTLELVNHLVAEGAQHIVLLMRHSAREYEPGKHDLLNPLTDEGRDLAHTLGEKLPKSLLIRGYSSPTERCIETASLIMAAHKAAGGETTRNRVVEALGVFYVLDQMKMSKAMREAGNIPAFLGKWYSGNMAPDIMMPPDTAATIIGRLAAEKLEKDPDAQQLDLMVSHDFTLYTIKNQLLGQDLVRYPEVRYLDGIALFRRDEQTWIQSHHGDAIELNV
ncbi:MAG: histidine phosphatase family protein [Gammaproteobacteria bacterium]|jgi:broad specificity phosphatase PhoE|nr:histidine phosphatase family protein [Gammaproteobacteria bacterium]MBT4493588.1 histidine phosphatase family protein [Gammaproteobacteria bacterium]MBT7371107.1 histidine phosphatase family protein [Gammaproteobacteria bacterium]